MDLLKKQDGTTILETLIGILILGIIVTISFALLIKVFGNQKLMNEQEAYQLANETISNSINTYSITDTSFNNNKGNLLVERKVLSEDMVHKITVKVYSAFSKNEIVSLTATIVK